MLGVWVVCGVCVAGCPTGGVVGVPDGCGVCCAVLFDANAYPVVRPRVAVVARPVARIFAEFATPGLRVFPRVRDDDADEAGGGGGRSGSFIISRRPRLRGDRHRRGLCRGGLRHLRGRHHRHGLCEEEQQKLASRWQHL